MKGRSIRRRLLAGVAVVQIVAAVLATVLVVRHERNRSYAMLDAGLDEHAAMVTAVIEPPETAADKTILHRELLTLPQRDIYVLLDEKKGDAIAASSDWRPVAPLPSAAQSFVNLRINGHRYRAIVRRSFPLFNDEPSEVARLPRLVLVYATRMYEVEEHVHSVAWVAAALGLAILLASLAATGWVVRAGLLPVTELAESAAKIDAVHWEWQPVGEQATELAPLSTTLSRLVERLREAFTRERQFSADAAHEMKTAVAIVKSTLQLALERERTAAEYRTGMERALEDTERIQGLVSGMLQLAKVEGLAAPERNSVDAVERLGTVVRRLVPVLEARQMRIAVAASEEKMPARISGEELGIVLMNLLENAIHYSPDGSAIEVKVEAQAEMCVLVIKDAGCGIDAESLPHIFERFYRSDRSRSRESGGAGLGLAIVHAIVDRAGGSVTAMSDPGEGSVFTVALPRG